MNDDKDLKIQDDRDFFQRVIGTLLLDECPKCHKTAYRPPSYGDKGLCSACDYSEPILIVKDEV